MEARFGLTVPYTSISTQKWNAAKPNLKQARSYTLLCQLSLHPTSRSSKRKRTGLEGEEAHAGFVIS